MQLAMEIPKPHLSELSALTDVDFALAHEVLEDAHYAKFYKEQRAQGRRVVLDNSMHELGTKALTVPELLEAAKKIDPSCVIAPDRLGDAKFTFESFEQLRKDPKLNWDPAIVIQGTTYEDRIKLFNGVRSFTQTMCLPYREPRLKWMTELIIGSPAYVKFPPYLHLLGMQDGQELVEFNKLVRQYGYPSNNVTVDTAKPIKWAMKGKKIDSLETLHGGGLLDHKAKMNDVQQALTLYNICVMRKAMA